MVIGGVPAVLHRLQVLGQLHLGVEQPVLLDVLLVLDLLLVAELGQGLLVLLVELGHRALVLLLGGGFFLNTAGGHRLEVLLVKVGVEIALGVGDELGHIILVAGLHRLGLLQLSLQLGEPGGLFLLGIDAVSLQAVDAALDVEDLVGALRPQGVDLCLNISHIRVDRLAELALLISRKNLCISHLQFLPL